MKNGIDISSYQGSVDFAAVKAAGVEFVYAKATEGTGFIDDRFADNHDDCKARGLLFGAYHFLRFTADPVEQARHFLATIDGRTGTLLPMVDVEVTDGATLPSRIANISAFLGEIEKSLGGKRALLYTDFGYWVDEMAGSAEFSGHPLWIAEYNDDTEPTLPSGFTKWTIWQYSSKGSVAGITGDVDVDRLNGDDLSVISR